MVSTVIISHQTSHISLLCGQKLGLPGNFSLGQLVQLDSLLYLNTYVFCKKSVNLQLSVFIRSNCENRYTAFGGPVPERPVEDLAFAVARFIQKGGSFVNYYMVRS